MIACESACYCIAQLFLVERVIDQGILVQRDLISSDHIDASAVWPAVYDCHELMLNVGVMETARLYSTRKAYNDMIFGTLTFVSSGRPDRYFRESIWWQV